MHTPSRTGQSLVPQSCAATRTSHTGTEGQALPLLPRHPWAAQEPFPTAWQILCNTLVIKNRVVLYLSSHFCLGYAPWAVLASA